MFIVDLRETIVLISMPFKKTKNNLFGGPGQGREPEHQKPLKKQKTIFLEVLGRGGSLNPKNLRKKQKTSFWRSWAGGGELCSRKWVCEQWWQRGGPAPRGADSWESRRNLAATIAHIQAPGIHKTGALYKYLS